MNEETVFAIYDSPEHAKAAVDELINAGVPTANISQHAKGSMAVETSSMSAEPVRERGFWASLFGGEPENEHDMAVLDRSVEGGSTVVTVAVASERLVTVSDILERHHPIDIEERAAGYGAVETTTTRTTTPAVPGVVDSTRPAVDSGTIQLSEEALVVGKRTVNRGTTRVRRYVVETPVEEQVTLRDERVSIERRPVTDNRPVTDTAFSEKVIEVVETGEEAVVSKKARIVEEVVIHKDATERTETVHDTVRREEVEVVQGSDVNNDGSLAASAPVKPRV